MVVQAGDWICWMDRGVMTYGCVVYVVSGKYADDGLTYYCANGVVSERAVLEVRRK